MSNVVAVETRRVWGLVLLRGILTLAFGVGTLVWPGATVLVMVTMFAIYSIADGIAAIAHGFSARRNGGGSPWWILIGLLGIVAGVVALVWPGKTALVLLYIIAFWALIGGISTALGSFTLRKFGIAHWGWMLVGGILSAIFGIILLVSPGTGLLSLLWLVATWAIALGLAEIVGAFWIRSAANEPAAQS